MKPEIETDNLYLELGAGDVDTYGLLNYLLTAPGGENNLKILSTLGLKGKPLSILADKFGDEGLVWMAENITSLENYELTTFLYQMKKACFITDQKREPSETEIRELLEEAKNQCELIKSSAESGQ